MPKKKKKATKKAAKKGAKRSSACKSITTIFFEGGEALEAVTSSKVSFISANRETLDRSEIAKIRGLKKDETFKMPMHAGSYALMVGC